MPNRPWRAMEDVPEGADGGNTEEIDPLELMAGVAEGAAPLPARKRKPALQGGRGVCFVVGCECTEGLKGVEPSRCADAMHALQHANPPVDLGEFKGLQRTLPLNSGHNKLCAKHYPKLPEKQIIGAKVLVKMADGNFKPATVTGPAPVAVGRVGRGARTVQSLAAPTKWCVAVWDGDGAMLPGVELSQEEVWTQSDLRAAYDSSVSAAADAAKKAAAKKIDALQHQVRYAQGKLGGHSPRPPAAPPRTPHLTAGGT